jgi:Fe-S-cluster containining protein
MWKYFHCQRCGSCCTQIGLPYDPEKIFEMANFLEMSVNDVIENYYGRLTPDSTQWVSNDSKRTPCPFLELSEGKYFCKIYSVRPNGCRLYPIDTDGGRGGVDCPGWQIAFSKLTAEQEESP